jgi:hypothetical protein
MKFQELPEGYDGPDDIEDRWNENGFGLITEGNSYFDVGAPGKGFSAYSSNFQSYLEAIDSFQGFLTEMKNEYEGTIPIILVYQFLELGGDHNGFYDADLKTISVAIGEYQESTENFVFEYPLTEPGLTPEQIGRITAHEIGHSMGLGHSDIGPTNLMQPGLYLGPPLVSTLTNAGSCRVRQGGLNPDLVMGTGTEYGIQGNTFIYGCGDVDIGGKSAFGYDEECEKTFTHTPYPEGPFEANCDAYNPTPDVRTESGTDIPYYDFGNERWGDYKTPYKCWEEIPSSHPQYDPVQIDSNICKVIPVCGDGYIDSDAGEDCEEDDDCDEEEKCGGTKIIDGEEYEIHCQCIPDCPDGQVWNEDINECVCPDGNEECGEVCCDEGEVCDEDSLVCVDNSCDSDNNCSPGEICIDGQCGDDGGVNPPSGSSGGRGDEPGVNLECPEGSECEPGSTYCEATYGPGWTCTTADEFGTCKCHPP